MPRINITIPLDADDYNELTELATRLHDTRAGIVRAVLAQYLRDGNKPVIHKADMIGVDHDGEDSDDELKYEPITD